jgi:hypothetical protein
MALDPSKMDEVISVPNKEVFTYINKYDCNYMPAFLDNKTYPLAMPFECIRTLSIAVITTLQPRLLLDVT